jgi:hypothetical protein
MRSDRAHYVALAVTWSIWVATLAAYELNVGWAIATGVFVLGLIATAALGLARSTRAAFDVRLGHYVDAYRKGYDAGRLSAVRRRP